MHWSIIRLRTLSLIGRWYRLRVLSLVLLRYRLCTLSMAEEISNNLAVIHRFMNKGLVILFDLFRQACNGIFSLTIFNFELSKLVLDIDSFRQVNLLRVSFRLDRVNTWLLLYDTFAVTL